MFYNFSLFFRRPWTGYWGMWPSWRVSTTSCGTLSPALTPAPGEKETEEETEKDKDKEEKKEKKEQEAGKSFCNVYDDEWPNSFAKIMSYTCLHSVYKSCPSLSWHQSFRIVVANLFKTAREEQFKFPKKSRMLHVMFKYGNRIQAFTCTCNSQRSFEKGQRSFELMI